LDNLINFKKSSGFFKRDNKFNSVVLNRLQGLKGNFFKTNFNLISKEKYNYKGVIYKKNINKYFTTKYLFKHINKINYQNQFTSKNMDIKIKSFFIFKKNREILNKLLVGKPVRQIKFNKIVKNFLKKTNLDILSNFEFKLITLLIRSGFFINFKDALFFIKNGYININNKIVTNPNILLNPNEILKVAFNKYYYIYYRRGLHNLINNVSKYNSYA
jgi:ribosomal protein S4